jgi:8-oxo-dGTP pyrophosphatase MutT (NUDIX family)
VPDSSGKWAAIRETIEETGLAPALVPQASAEVSEALRAGLSRQVPLSALLGEHRLAIDLEALTPFARWLPNLRETRRFDTLFFIARAPDGEAVADGGEAVRAFWTSAADVLAQIARGQARAIFPTRRILERLARFGSLEEAREDAARHGMETITPWTEERGGIAHLCIPEGRGYPVTSEPLASARRV